MSFQTSGYERQSMHVYCMSPQLLRRQTHNDQAACALGGIADPQSFHEVTHVIFYAITGRSQPELFRQFDLPEQPVSEI